MTPKNKKTSHTTEVVLGAASSSLRKGITELKEAAEHLESLHLKSDDLQLQVVAKEGQIEELSIAFAEKLRAHEVEFGLKVKENSLKVVEDTLSLHHLVAVPKQELELLKQEVQEWGVKFEDKVNEKVKASSGAIAGTFDQKTKLLEAEYKAKEAQNLASIESLKSQVTSLEGQIAVWKTQLDAERDASVQR